jgi:SAM-dependent methyltransferase
MPAYDYTSVADIYDDFCVFGGDIAFFQEVVASRPGPILELMAGTGRVSLPMLATGAELTCVDRFPAMLSVLARKARSRDLPRLVCADVCRLPLEAGFRTVVLPFQGFTELLGEEEQRQALAEAARVLPPDGRFYCTSHNPAVRGAAVDGCWHELGRFPDQAGRTLVLHLKTSHSQRPGLVEGCQRIDILDRDGSQLESRSFAIEFSLTPASTIIAMAAAVGLELLELLGDYQGAAYDERTSACLIAVLSKP